MKICNKCHIEKQPVDFFSDKNKLDGLTTFCKSCKKSSNEAWRQRNLDKDKSAKAKYYQANKDYCYKLSKAWHENHREISNAHKALWKKRHHEQNLEINRRCAKNNPEAYKAKSLRNSRKRQFLLAQSKKYLPANLVAEVKAFYRNAPEGLIVDHVIPLRGPNVNGLHVPWNLQYLTLRQNLLKGNKVPTVGGNNESH